MLSAGLSRKTVVRSRLPPEPPLSSSSRTTCRGLVAFRFGGRAPEHRLCHTGHTVCGLLRTLT